MNIISIENLTKKPSPKKKRKNNNYVFLMKTAIVQIYLVQILMNYPKNKLII